MKKKAFKKKMIGKRITLKQHEYTKDHAKVLYSLINNNRGHLLPWLQWVHDTKKVKDIYAWLKEMKQDWKTKEGAAYAIYLGKRCIGNVSLYNIDYNKSCGELGYWMDKDFVNNGYTTEAVKMLEKEFFKRGLNKIVMICDEDNSAVDSVAKKFHYTLEGVMRQNAFYREGGGEYRNQKVYSKLYHEWEFYRKTNNEKSK